MTNINSRQTLKLFTEGQVYNIHAYVKYNTHADLKLLQHIQVGIIHAYTKYIPILNSHAYAKLIRYINPSCRNGPKNSCMIKEKNNYRSKFKQISKTELTFTRFSVLGAKTVA